MKISAINTQNNFSFGSQIRETNTLGWAVNRAIKIGDKGFFNALKHLSNDGLKREILVGGSNAGFKNSVKATATLSVDKIQYILRTSQSKKRGLDGFQLMGDNVIELIKKLASETGNISKKALNETATEDVLVEEGNELYRTILID